MAFSIGGRSVEFTSTNVVIRYEVNGVMKEKTAAEIQANVNGEIAEVQAILGISADTIVSVDTDYEGGVAAPEDTDGGSWLTTWNQPGKELAYSQTDYQANFLTDEGAAS